MVQQALALLVLESREMLEESGWPSEPSNKAMIQTFVPCPTGYPYLRYQLSRE